MLWRSIFARMFQPVQMNLTKEPAGLPTFRMSVSKFRTDNQTVFRLGQQLGNSENVDIVLKNFFDLQLPVGASQLIGWVQDRWLGHGFVWRSRHIPLVVELCMYACFAWAHANELRQQGSTDIFRFIYTYPAWFQLLAWPDCHGVRLNMRFRWHFPSVYFFFPKPRVQWHFHLPSHVSFPESLWYEDKSFNVISSVEMAEHVGIRKLGWQKWEATHGEVTTWCGQRK